LEGAGLGGKLHSVLQGFVAASTAALALIVYMQVNRQSLAKFAIPPIFNFNQRTTRVYWAP